ncbi:cell wall/vacuolar inhibitor of fructosidase 1-like [Trifolium medium]|uniref:Cell wall/vacuolar inhibitor of fructosidase 1-like n=1 Tax=Trifolium medium TaxID=97028 RepID=A0A392R3D8_9FABA|nr:cell wall/vacuolar inhibitor of fructosidase 1-like [Trifolium medium]
MKNKANTALNKIHQLIGKSPPDQMAALNSCASKYDAIVVAVIPSAIAALQNGNPKFAEQSANDAAIDANGCENRSSGKLPLAAENNAMRDASVITAAIIRNLL